jgi:hypothetical protein
VVTEAVERDTLRNLSGEISILPLVEKRPGLLPRVRRSDVADSVFVHLDLVRHFTVEHDGLAREALLAAQRSVIPRKNSIDAHHTDDSIHNLTAECLEARAHQLHHRPSIVAIDNERRTSVSLAMNDTIRIRYRLQPNPATHCPLDAVAPPFGIYLDVRVGFDESERDLRARAPECPAEGPIATITNENDTRFGCGTLGDITSVNPRVAGLPSP